MNASSSDSRRLSLGSHSGVKIALISGFLVGAATAVLFAPKRGEDLRKELADSARRAARRASQTIAETSMAVSDAVSRGRRAVRAAGQAYRGTAARVPSPVDARQADLR